MPQETTALVVMGPSGVGKTTTAKLLAERLDWPFAEADEFHSAANIAKMESGQPLNDNDRAPWLVAIRDWITGQAAGGVSTVVACSALKRCYRDVLREADARVRFVSLTAEQDLVGERLGRRTGHYMPKSLLQSQFDDLEPLQSDEDGVTISVGVPPEAVVTHALEALGFDQEG
ncbi:gluconokinase [Aurantimonas marina]|uniref:gluconokinase n=1 Tax=Aurantimonas marina TaxID=2780508 RepID=UPI001E613B7C|nr:gluconokinase [Aurantimonas marina]